MGGATAMEVMVDTVWDMARDLLRPTTVDMAMVDTEAMATVRGLLMLRPTMATEATAATAMERGPPMLRPLLLPSQRLMLTMAMVATVATDTARGLLMPMLTTVAMDMAAMVATDTARGLLMPMLTMAVTDMAAMDTARGLLMPTTVATDTAATVMASNFIHQENPVPKRHISKSKFLQF